MSLARTGFKRGTKRPWWGDRGEFRTIAGSRGDLNGGVTAGLFPNRMERARGDGLAAALGRWSALMSGERATVLLDLARAQPVSHHSPRLGREGVCMFGGGAPELVAAAPAAPAAPAPRCGRAVLMMCVTAAQQNGNSLCKNRDVTSANFYSACFGNTRKTPLLEPTSSGSRIAMALTPVVRNGDSG